MLIRLEVETEDYMDEVLVDVLNNRCPSKQIVFSVLPYDDHSGVAVEVNIEPTQPLTISQVGTALLAFLNKLEEVASVDFQ